MFEEVVFCVCFNLKNLGSSVEDIYFSHQIFCMNNNIIKRFKIKISFVTNGLEFTELYPPVGGRFQYLQLRITLDFIFIEKLFFFIWN